MSITDELRMGGIYRFPSNRRVFTEEELTAIADRIDAEAEDNERFRREAGPFCDRLRDAAAERADVTLFGVDYTALPLDADGVPIRIGDVLDEIAVATYPFVPAKVVGYHECCGEVLPIVENDGEFQVIPEKVCHYHAPTVEDVLTKMLEQAVGYSDAHTTVAANAIVEFAAKLRLAGENV